MKAWLLLALTLPGCATHPPALPAFPLLEQSAAKEGMEKIGIPAEVSDETWLCFQMAPTNDDAVGPWGLWVCIGPVGEMRARLLTLLRHKV